MVRGSKVDIPNPFNNNEYKPIFLLSTQESNVIKKNDLNKRLSEIEKNLEAVESLLNDAKSVIVDEDEEQSIHRSQSLNGRRDEDVRYKIIELKRRLSSQKSLSDIKSESDLSNSGKLRHYRSASILSDRIERQGKGNIYHNDYVYGNSGKLYSESNLDLLSLPGFKYEYTQKDQELKLNINALRDRLIRKRISDTALSLKAYPSQSNIRLSSLRQSPEPDTQPPARQSNKRLSVIEDSYEKLTSAEADRKRSIQHDNKLPRRSLSYGYLRYSQYTNKSSPALSPAHETFSELSDVSSTRKVLHMVKSIESMNGSILSPTLNSKLVDKEKLAKLAELRHISERRVETLRRRLTAEDFSKLPTLDNRRSIAEKELQLADESLLKNQTNVKNRIEDLKHQVSQRKINRSSKTKSQILDANYNAHITASIGNQRTLSRTSQYLKEKALSQGLQKDELLDIEPSENTLEKSYQPADQEKPNQEPKPDARDSKQSSKSPNTTTTNGTSVSSNVRNSTSSESGYSNNHDYASTKPDLESVSQNLTYRRSAFADGKQVKPKLSDSSIIVDNIQEVNEDENINKTLYNNAKGESNNNDTSEISSNDEIYDLAPSEALVFDGEAPQSQVGRHLSVRGYKSHGKSHSLSSNLSITGNSPAGNLSMAGNTPSGNLPKSPTGPAEFPKLKLSPDNASTNHTSVHDSPHSAGETFVQGDVEERDLFPINQSSSHRTSNSSKVNKSKLRHKLSSRRSFNVLKQSIVESSYSVQEKNQNARGRDRSVSTPQHNMRHKIHPKRQKNSFFRKLASIFKRKD